MSFDRFVLSVKRRDGALASRVHDVHRRLLAFDMPDEPAFRLLYDAFFVGHSLHVDASEWLRSKFLYAPMLRARAEHVGYGLNLTSAPYIRGNVRISIGDRCSFSSFDVRTAKFAAEPEISFGDDCWLGGQVLFGVTKRVAVGKSVLIAGRVDVQDADGHPSEPERRMRGEQMAETDTRPVTLEDYVFLGRDVHVLKGVTIGRGAVIASGSVVASDIPAGAFAVGVPARVVKTRASDP